jgi:hypothetical protein
MLMLAGAVGYHYREPILNLLSTNKEVVDLSLAVSYLLSYPSSCPIFVEYQSFHLNILGTMPCKEQKQIKHVPSLLFPVYILQLPNYP